MEAPAWRQALHHDECQGRDGGLEADLPPRLAAWKALSGADARFLRALLREQQGRVLVDKHGRWQTLCGCRHLAMRGRKSRTTFLLTINADSHPLLRRMHKPGDDKRSLVIVQQRDYGT